MGNPSQGAQMAGAPGGARGAQQALIVVFERDESLAGTLLSQLRSHGYEGRSARLPVEVFDLIARYPVKLVLVNLGQAATGRREFWVALDAQRLGRGVQVITYRFALPGVEPDLADGSGRADVEIRGAVGFSALVEAVRAKLPLAPPQPPNSSFLVGSGVHSWPRVNGQPVGPPAATPAEYASRQPIAGVLNLSAGAGAAQAPDFAPLPGAPGAPVMNPANGGWMPERNGMPPMPGGQPSNGMPPMPAGQPSNGTPSSMPGGQPLNGSLEQRAQQWLNSYTEAPRPPAEAATQARPGAPQWAEMPGSPQMNGAGGQAAQMGGPPPGMENHAPSGYSPAMPIGDLAALSDAINALAAAGAPGYHQAAAAANAMNARNMPGGAGSQWGREPNYPPQDAAMPPVTDRGGASHYVAPAPMREGRPPSDQMPDLNQMNAGAQAPGRGAAEAMYMAQQAFADLRLAHDAPQPQGARSRALPDNMEDYEYQRRERPTHARSMSDESPSPEPRRPSGDMGVGAVGNQHVAYQQHQMLAPVVAPGHVERSLSTVLVEGQLVSQQKLEVAVGIQRLLRGVDIDYRLGEVLLLFKFLTPDQLLAALLVSRGLVAPAQVAAMGRIKQELHAIGMEYDLENLLILFRLLSSEQLREIRSEFP